MKRSLPGKFFICTASAPGEKQMEIHYDLIHLDKTRSKHHLHLQTTLRLKDVVSLFSNLARELRGYIRHRSYCDVSMLLTPYFDHQVIRGAPLTPLWWGHGLFVKHLFFNVRKLLFLIYMLKNE